MAESLGLQQLIASKSVVIKQRMTVFEGNKYLILDSNGKPFLFAEEESGWVSFMGSNDRPFHMKVCDEKQKQVLSIRRPFTFGPDKMEVSLFDTVVSVIRQKPTMMTPVIYINDASDNPVLRVRGPPPRFFSTGDYVFDLQTASKVHIGVINKKWRGFLKEMIQADVFEIEFPGDLDVRFKAAVIGACFLIDFLYFERTK